MANNETHEAILKALTEIQRQRSSLEELLTEENIQCLKEMVEDKKAVSRVFSKIKLFLVSAMAGLIAILFFYEKFILLIKNIVKGV